MAGKRIVIPNYMPALDINGDPVAGAKITFYENGTTTLKSIYTSAALNVAHPNPISANAAGVFASIFADEDEEFSVAITDADGNPIAGLRNRDNVAPSMVYGQEAAESAADMVFTAADAGAIVRPSQDKLRESQAAEDYGASDAASTAVIIAAANTAISAAAIKGKWRVMGPERVDATLFGINPGNAAARNSTLLQAAINASYGKQLVIPIFGDGVTQRIEFDTTLVVDPIYNGANRPIHIRGAGFDSDGGFSGTRLMYTGTSGYAIEMINPTNDSADTQIILEGFGLYGNGIGVLGGGGIKAVRVNGGLVMRSLWVSGFYETGVYFEHCYGAKLEDSIIARNTKDGIAITDRSNNFVLDNVKAVGNANIPGLHANIRVSAGVGSNCLAPSLRNCDWSYAGIAATNVLKRSNDTLTSIAVASNVATVTAPSHGYTAGQFIAIRGATVDVDLNGIFAFEVATVPNANTFTVATANVPDGTYSEATLAIYPYGYGLVVSGATGMSIWNHYVETCSGQNTLINGTTESFVISGGYNQDGFLFVEGVINGRIGPIHHLNTSAGYRGGRYINLGGNHNVSVSSADKFQNNGAGTLTPQQVMPDVFMVDEEYFGAAPPASGTWTVGRRVWNTAAAAGGSPGWVCTTAGTPGTWKAMASLAA